MSILLVGTGRVATALARRFAERDYPIEYLYGRSADRARMLAWESNSLPLGPADPVPENIETVLLAVSDGAIESVARQLAPKLDPDVLVAHTSGATPATVLAPHFKNFGTFYPLQTFTTGRTPDWTRLPILVDANSTTAREHLRRLARKISSKVSATTDEERANLHVAAVMVNNFTNHLYHLAQRFCADHHIDFKLLLPLIRETSEKIQDGRSPDAAQTGPARRGDETTIQRHLSQLETYPELHELYRWFTDSIQRDDPNVEPPSN